MVIYINDEETTVDENLLVSDLVEHLKLQTNGLALAVNNAIVQQQKWSFTNLQQNDKVLIISATKGG